MMLRQLIAKEKSMNTKGKKQIRSFSVYLDKNGNSIYYDRFTKCGYLLKEEVFAQFRTYNNRYLLAFMFGILAYNFITDLRWTILITVGIAVVMEFFFRKKFLTHLTKYPNFKPVVKAQENNSEPKSKIIMRMVLYLAFAVLIVLNAYQQKYGNLILFTSYLAAVIAVYGALHCVRDIVRK